MDTLNKRLHEHYEAAVSKVGENRLIGVFLQGAQNYGLQTYKSDVDTKAVVFPSLEEVCLSKKPVNFVHLMENEEHVEFKDLRLMVNLFQKQNPSYVEVLFTKYYVVNPKYSNLWETLRAYREKVVRYDPNLFVKCVAGMAKEKYRNMTKYAPLRPEDYEKFGYYPKELHHLVRLRWLLSNYLYNRDTPYETYLNLTNYPEMRDFLIEVKLGKLNLQEATDMANVAMKEVNVLVDRFNKEKENYYFTKEELDKFFNTFLVESVSTFLKEEAKKNE